MKTAAFTGSRTLPASAHQLVASIVESLLADKYSISCGCAVGADAAVVSALLDKGEAERLTLFAIGGPCGTGFAGPHSSLAGVLDAASAGATMKWWAGGDEATRLRVRLVARSLECMSSASSVIGFVSTMPSKPWKGNGPWYSCGSGS